MSNDPLTTEDAQAVDSITAGRFRTGPVEDRSGMLQPLEPDPVDATEDEQFAAVMGRYYPGSVAS